MSKGTLMIANQGISQTERWLDTLVPDYVQIDSRDITQLINYIHKISPQFNYYNNQTNEVDGTWEDFLSGDPYMVTLLISLTRISNKIDEFEKIIKEISAGQKITQKIKGLNEAIAFLFDMEAKLSRLQKQLINFNTSNNLEEVITSIRTTESDLIVLRSYCEECASTFTGFVFSNPFPDLNKKEKHSINREGIFIGNSDKDRVQHSLPFFTQLFNSIFGKYNFLVTASKSFIARRPILESQFNPQIGLLLGFLNLYSLAQKQINGINERHLNYYYNNLLQLKRKHGHPDLVHLIIEPEPGVKKLEIDTSNLLIAEATNNEEALIYQLNNPTTLNLATIAEIKTIFVSSFKQIEAPKIEIPDLIERQVYEASHKLFMPGEFLKNPDVFQSWPALGEDQHEQFGDMRSMEDSDIGLNIASPLFYLPEGKRTIRIKICLRATSFDRLVRYFSHVAELTEKKRVNIINELLSNAFTISYTSPKSWETIKKYAVIFDVDNKKEKMVEVVLRLKDNDPAIGNYSKEIHNRKFNSKFPLIRLGLNNFSKHHPYSFFKETEIKRIIITSKVKGSKSMGLQNNIGLISPTSPFQIFGPQPIIGSFLDIRNPNIFNRYLTDFSIAIDWLNLPRELGGLETYYKEYDEPFKNESFAVSVKALKKENRYSAERDIQQKPLFMLKGHGSFLESHTIIDNIDFNKLQFLNEASQTGDEDSEVLSNAGVLRLELCSPPEAFGQQSFPLIFPKSVMNQAKKKAVDQKLPNQPIIPIVKEISIDYVLEYSENFDGSNADNSNIHLIHDYPFGYECVYPNKYKNQINFMPVFSDDGNLCIGLKEVEPNSELNIMFNFEDYCFHFTLHKAELITWSYLENNNWVNFKKKDILFDSTNNFIRSGIVRMSIPATIKSHNTIMNPDLFWIRATAGNKAGVQPRIIGIALNAAIATRKSSMQTCSETNVTIVPGRIKGFEKTVKGVNSVWQLFPSINGRSPETLDKFYVRISERLRHKQRPIQVRDITQVVLEQFPQILMVKCFNTEVENYYLVPGTDLHLVLIPKEIKKGDFLKETPQVSLSTLFEVKSFLYKILSPFVKIEVGNPIYEKVKIICKVSLVQKATEDSGYYIRELINEINYYIAPWLKGTFDDFKIGNRIYKSDLLMFIKSRPYISHVTGFSVIHFYNHQDAANDNIISELTDTAVDHYDYIVSSSPASVLLPSQHHIITVLEEPVNEPAVPSGIGSFIVGEELIIADDLKEKAQNNELSLEDEEEEERFSLIITH